MSGTGTLVRNIENILAKKGSKVKVAGLLGGGKTTQGCGLQVGDDAL